MQIGSTSPRHNAFEQQYNLRIKVNHRNGAVTVHGPTLPASSHYQPFVPPRTPMQYSPLPKPISTRSLQSPPAQPLCSNLSQRLSSQMIVPAGYGNAATGSLSMGSSASHSQMSRSQFHVQTITKANSDAFQQKKRLTSETSAGCELEYPRKEPNYYLQKVGGPQGEDYEIDCVICQKKFTSKQFEQHLQLHRNARKKPNNSPINQSQIMQTKCEMSAPWQCAKISNEGEANHELLYSFHKSNAIMNQSVRESLSSNQSSRHKQFQIQFKNVSSKPAAPSVLKDSSVLQVRQIVPTYDVRAELNSQKSKSGASSSNVSLSSSIQTGQPIPFGSHQIENQSGIRYLGTVPMPQSMHTLKQERAINTSFTSLHSERLQNSVPINHSLGVRINNSRVVSQRSSQINSSSASGSQKKTLQNLKAFELGQAIDSHNNNNANMSNLNQHQGQRKPQQKELAVNPFALIEHQESKVYEYFPDSQHFSLSQHRVSTSSKLVAEPLAVHHGMFQGPQQVQQRVGHGHGIAPNIDNDNCLSQMSESSISSVRSQNQPLEAMSKETLLRIHYRRNRSSKINLMNIEGRSEALARESLTSHTPYSASNTGRPANLRGQTAYSRTNYPVLEPDDRSILIEQEPRYHNLDAIAAQSKQIYRGTQVEEDDFRGFESYTSLTKSSKSSAKTKMPHNYLAVDDFIKSSGRA